MEASALLYSGRPNPSWRVPAPLAQRVRETLAEAPAAGAGGGKPPGLGYSGIRLRYEDEDGGARTADLFGGVAVLDGRRLADPQRQLERALLASGEALFPRLRDLL
jgi:hypothetical protein